MVCSMKLVSTKWVNLVMWSPSSHHDLDDVKLDDSMEAFLVRDTFIPNTEGMTTSCLILRDYSLQFLLL